MQKRIECAIGILTATAPAAKSRRRNRIGTRLHLLHPVAHISGGNLDVEADIIQHLLDGLYDTLIIGRRGEQSDFGFGRITNFRHQLPGFLRIIFWSLYALNKPK
ncbi:hypothetical protein D3C81_1886510 [compost metagenome]